MINGVYRIKDIWTLHNKAYILPKNVILNLVQIMEMFCHLQKKKDNMKRDYDFQTRLFHNTLSKGHVSKNLNREDN